MAHLPDAKDKANRQKRCASNAGRRCKIERETRERISPRKLGRLNLGKPGAGASCARQVMEKGTNTVRQLRKNLVATNSNEGRKKENASKRTRPRLPRNKRNVYTPKQKMEKRRIRRKNWQKQRPGLETERDPIKRRASKVSLPSKGKSVRVVIQRGKIW